MAFKLLDKDSTMFILAILCAVVLLWVVYPKLFKNGNGVAAEEAFERFNSQEETPEMESEAEAEVAPEIIDGPPKAPHVDAKTGMLVDGPGFERGPIEGTFQETPTSIPSNYYFLDDGAGGEMSIQHNLCSRSCCSEQWPTPFKKKYDPYVCQNKDKFVPSRIMCNNTFQDSGCLCLTKKQSQFLYNRGGNGREWF